MALFAEEGFEHVPVARVAKAAEVSEATVFNYFPTKEDLVYDGMADFASAVLAALQTLVHTLARTGHKGDQIAETTLREDKAAFALLTQGLTP